MSKTAIYKRVSTDAQETAMQEHAINKWMAERGWDSAVEYQDVGASGKTMDRPGFQELRAAVEAGEVNRVVVYRLDRLSRDAIAVMRLLMDWMQRDVEFFAVDQPILSFAKDDVFRLTKLSIFSELAQIERETIVSRIKAGLAAAKSRGVLPGPKPATTREDVELILRLRQQGLTLSEIANKVNISKTTVHKIARKGHKYLR